MESEKGITAEPTGPIFKAAIQKNNSKRCFFCIGALIITVIIILIVTITFLVPEDEDSVNPLSQYSNQIEGRSL